MSEYLILFIVAAYLIGLLFLAYFGEKYFSRLSNNGLVYALSLTVYCTAWTFYGSVGRASTEGVNFLAIYIGPLLTVPFWWFLLRKMVRITHTLRISSIADFISSRYGKNAQLGTVVAIASFLAVIPYIALQFKAINSSIHIMSATTLFDASLLIVFLLTVFVILFGARNVDANQRKPGLISAIVAESVVKLVAFIVLGAFVVYGMFDGFGDIFDRASATVDVAQLTSFASDGAYSDWFFISLISAIAFLLLPRQFQLSSIEAGKERHILSAMRVVPMYLLLINVFVIPIAMAGLVLLPNDDPDFFVLSLPLFAEQKVLAILVFLGGLSAATSMILVSTTALSTMMSNYIFIPLVLNTQKEEATERKDYQSKLLLWRRVSTIIIMILAWAYYKTLVYQETLVEIGIISFIAIAQLAPAFFGGLYWKKATKKAAMAGIISGLVIWFFFLVWPILETNLLQWLQSDASGASTRFISEITDQLGVSRTSSAIILSLMVNIGCYVYFSFTSEQSAKELNQAELFVDIFRYSGTFDSSVAWRGTAYFPDLHSLLSQFIGKRRTDAILERYARSNGIDWAKTPQVDSKLISYVERILTGIIGPSSARIMVSKVVQEETVDMKDVINILHESQEAIRLNKELQLKSQQLAKASDKLQAANAKLQEYSDLKNEFLYTVTHELRTPITSIRALSELLEDNPDLETEERETFVSNIIYEAERMSKLISNVLDLEKFESGSQQLERDRLDLHSLVQDEVTALKPLINGKNIRLEVEINNSLDFVFADGERIRQVITNIFGNAAKYCDQENGLIRVTAYRQNDYIKVNVSNNGTPIHAEDLDNIFDKFYQIRNQTRKKPTGHGLGLAICKNIIEMHNGRIAVENHEGLVRFSFSLPVYKSTEK